MSARIDEEIAWRLVRALCPGSVPDHERLRVEAEGGFVIEVDQQGGWRADAPVDDEGRALFDIYLPLRVKRDLVIGQLGQSLDGRIATESGASHFVTGPQDIERLHRLRALVDAVIVGATTVADDDPQLTVRRVEGANPVRVVLDPSGRIGPGVRVRTDQEARTLLVRRAPHGADDADLRAEGLRSEALRGEELLIPASDDGLLDLAALLQALRAEGLGRVLVEGGGVTVSRFLEAGLLDRLHLTVAPLLIGSGRPSLTLEVIQSLDEAMRPASRHFTLGRDVLFDLDLRADA